jgi:hypothetical protein
MSGALPFVSAPTLPFFIIAFATGVTSGLPMASPVNVRNTGPSLRSSQKNSTLHNNMVRSFGYPKIILYKPCERNYDLMGICKFIVLLALSIAGFM